MPGCRTRWIAIAGTAIAVSAVRGAEARAADAIPLDKLGNLRVELDLQGEGSLFVRLFTDDYDHGTLAGAICGRPAAKAKARFNGWPLVRLTGIYRGGDLQYDRDCLLELAFPGPLVHETTATALGGRIPIRGGMRLGGPIPARARSPGPASIRIDEGKTHLVFEIPDAFSPRRLTFVSPADGILHRGQRVSVRWQPGSDDISQTEIALSPLGSIRVDDSVVIPKEDLVINGDRIDFRIPTALPDRLHGPIEIRVIGTAYVKPRFGPCPVDRCSVSLIFDVAPLPARLP